MSLSIIIPTLNEEAALPATLESIAALKPAPIEIIVADSGSEDRTVDVARAHGVRVLADLSRGRAGQMNAGAQQAIGDQLCFLHADSEIPADFVDLVDQVLSDPNTALAGFISVMRGETGVRRMTTAHNFIKTWYAPLLFRPLSFFGEQGSCSVIRLWSAVELILRRSGAGTRTRKLWKRRICVCAWYAADMNASARSQEKCGRLTGASPNGAFGAPISPISMLG